MTARAICALLLLSIAPLARGACANPQQPCVQLSWQMNAASDPAVSFRVFRTAANGTAFALTTGTAANPSGHPQMCNYAIPATALSCEDDDLVPGATYRFYVVSVDAEGAVSAPSNILTWTVVAPGTPSNLAGSQP